MRAMADKPMGVAVLVVGRRSGSISSATMPSGDAPQGLVHPADAGGARRLGCGRPDAHHVARHAHRFVSWVRAGRGTRAPMSWR